MTGPQEVIAAFDVINAYSIIYGLVDGKMFFGPWVVYRHKSPTKYWLVIGIFAGAMLAATIWAFGVVTQ